MLSLVVQVVFFVLGALLVIGGALALAGRLPGNSFFGVRTPETRVSPEAWRLANRTAGVGFLAAGLSLVAGAFCLLTAGGVLGWVLAVFGAVFAVGMMAYGGLMGAKTAAIWRDQAAADGTLPDALTPFGSGAGESCCGGAPAEDAEDCAPEACGTDGSTCSPADAADPAADCGVSGGCGSCSLQGMCTAEAGTGSGPAAGNGESGRTH